MRLTATTVLSFVVCPREAWFIHHSIIPDQENPFLELGRFVHESSYKNKGEKNVELPGMKIDLIWKENEATIVGEIKKSSRSIKGARIQLLYYIYALRERGIAARGYILIPKERKKIEVVLGEKERQELNELLQTVEMVVSSPVPPTAEKRSICNKCAYAELCWA